MVIFMLDKKSFEYESNEFFLATTVFYIETCFSNYDRCSHKNNKICAENYAMNI